MIIIILATVAINFAFGGDGLIRRAEQAKEYYANDSKYTDKTIENMESYINERITGIEIEQVTDINPGILEGNGTEAEPYVINSIEDLVFFAYDVTSGNTYAGETVTLGTNLDFNSNKSYIEPFRTNFEKYGYKGELKTLLTTETGFIPIGTTSNVNQADYSFAGIFDGNDNVIVNLYQNINVQDNEVDLR